MKWLILKDEVTVVPMEKPVPYSFIMEKFTSPVVLKIDFPEDEIVSLKKQNKIITTRVSDDYDKYHVGDIVVTKWNVKYKIIDRKDFKKIKDHPFYNELTAKQKSIISKYDKYCVLTLVKI